MRSADVANNTFYIWRPGTGFYRSVDGGVTFAPTNPAAFATVGISDRFTVATPPATCDGIAGEVWASTSDALYRSSNYGSSFSKIQNVTAVVHFAFGIGSSPSQPPYLYLYGRIAPAGATDPYRLYRSADYGATWLDLTTSSQRLPRTIVVEGDAHAPGVVYVGTKGRGVFVGSP